MTAKQIKGALTGALAEAGLDRRFQEPETMTVGELLEIAEALKLPVQIGGRT